MPLLLIVWSLFAQAPHTGAVIQAAIEAAAFGGTVTLDAGAMYDVTMPIDTRRGDFTLDCNGATLRRADVVTTTLSAPVAIGDNSFTVADASLFSVGMQVSPVKNGGANYEDGDKNRRHIIASINGNTIETEYTTAQYNYAAGDLLITSFTLFELFRGDNVIIKNCIFDGNRANNDTWLAWNRHTSLHFQGDNVTLIDSEFYDSQADAVLLRGSNQTVRNNHFHDLNGAAFHCSDIDGATIDGNIIERVAEQADRAEHTEGAFTISILCYNITIINNAFRNTDRYAIAPFHADMSNWIVEGNSFVNMAGLWRGNYANGTEPLRNISFTNNYADNAGDIYFRSVDPALAIDGLNISNNIFATHTNVYLENATGALNDNLFCAGATINNNSDVVENGNTFLCQYTAINGVEVDAASTALNWLLLLATTGLIMVTVATRKFL